jgi:hypothetical protein
VRPVVRPLLLLLVTASCATSGGAPTTSAAARVAGPYVGSFRFDDQPFYATLDLVASDAVRLSGSFRVSAPVDIDGEVDGAAIDELLRVTVRYRDERGCAGRIEGILTVENEGALIEGPVTVDDCGRLVAGRMSFRREEPTR